MYPQKAPTARHIADQLPKLAYRELRSTRLLYDYFYGKSVLLISLRVHQKFLLIIGRFSRLRGNCLIKNAFHCLNNILFRLNINLWLLIYIFIYHVELTYFKFIFAFS